MSVLYKALQKAAKENEQQAADPSAASDVPESNAFDPERLAGAGSISGKKFGGGDNNLKLAGGAAAAVLLMVVVGFFVFGGSDDTTPVQMAQAPTPQAPTPQAPAPEPASQAPAQTPMDVARQAASSSQPPVTDDAVVSANSAADMAGGMTSEPDSEMAGTAQIPAPADSSVSGEDSAEVSNIVALAQGSDGASAPESMTAPPAESVASSLAAASPTQTAAALGSAEASASQTSAASATQAAAAPTQTADAAPPASSDPMPRLDANSPARALSPPISIRRAEAEFAGVGNLVTVREVSQSAQDNVTAGYNALVRGDIGLALELYSAAVDSEPTSVLAQLGRSASLQKLGRMEEARGGYENVLRLDPNNREALTNLTSIYSARAPNEALNRLLDLEREYPGFSPVKAQIGLLYARMGSTADALAYLRQAASQDPATVMYQYNLAVLLDRMGRAEQAVVSYERVLAGIISGGAAGNLSRAGIERRVRYLKTL